MLRVFGALSRYVQGPDAIDAIDAMGPYLAPLGRRALLVADRAVLERISHRARVACSTAGIECVPLEFSGEITPQEVSRLTALAYAKSVVRHRSRRRQGHRRRQGRLVLQHLRKSNWIPLRLQSRQPTRSAHDMHGSPKFRLPEVPDKLNGFHPGELLRESDQGAMRLGVGHLAFD